MLYKRVGYIFPTCVGPLRDIVWEIFSDMSFLHNAGKIPQIQRWDIATVFISELFGGENHLQNSQIPNLAKIAKTCGN